MDIRILIILAGIGQICLALGSITIPKILGWKEELQKLSPMLRHIFWVYAAYILVTNFSFGLLSLLAPETLIDSTLLATIVSGFIALHWVSRLFIQFFYFKRSNFPKGFLYNLGEIALVGLFIFLSAVYLFVFYHNLYR